MVIGVSVREKTAAAARYWRHLRFKTLRRRLLTPHEGEIRLPSPSREVHGVALPPLRIKVSTSHEELLRWLQLEYFGFFHPTSIKEGSEDCTNSDVCVHVGPPKSLGYPYTLVSEASNFSEAIRQIEERATWEETDSVRSLHSTRWITQPLLDGFVSRRVVAHVGLTSGNIPQTLAVASRLKLELSPSEVSPYYCASDLLSSWGLFGVPDPNSKEFRTDDVSRLVQLAHASIVLPMYRGLWMNGAALCNDKGDAVLILGPRRSGKTTLALHCLAMSSPRLRVVGLENFYLAETGNLVDTTSGLDGLEVLLMGLPTSVKVGVGALLGTLRANPMLVEAAHTFQLSPSTIQQLIRNNDSTIWNIGSSHQIHIEEAFGRQRWCPTIIARLKGILILNWDVQELSRSHSRVSSQVLKWDSREKGLRLLTALAEKKTGTLFKGHYLLRSLYDERNAMTLLENFIFGANDFFVPPLYELQGSVSFDAAVKLICNHILQRSDS
ncbi:hypothetical protein TraAM80_03620 [Trypanosoma rangeli]|uniref:Uncharacterized protein n=1 Tax=Trypanosoma rangeli TaxID=5698 RepID=A0A422NMI0_TRYRA|nr:uncharacterized protein TraAM80_03620 [Trypanosoma rangeli]RNF06675.1 hypothetical protein TraAM80_03620 [Trypanosoma rangeli]|eukprot:RNF06675.1 hypothetical protein TraAM80_03620 [Trypanosoma rangeli]